MEHQYQRQSSANGYDAVPNDERMQREVFRADSSNVVYGSGRGAAGQDAGYSTEFSSYNYPSATPAQTNGSFSPRSSSYSAGRNSGSAGMVGTVAAVGPSSVFTRGSLLDREIEAMPVESSLPAGKPHKYKGRYRVWPGVLLLVVLVGGAAFGITIAAMNKHSSATKADEEYEQRVADSTTINGGTSGSGSDIVSDDGAVGNPKSYPDMGCELPNYESKNGRIVAVAANGTEVIVDIKGINWFGMETGNEIPFGMWSNADNGTTGYQIAKFLSDNKFNAVRLPLMIEAILSNPVPNTALINEADNRAVDVTDYISLLKSIVKLLGYRQIGVLLSMHTLTATESGGLWYDTSLGITEDDFLDAVDVLTSSLCSEKYWNIMGIDVKNEPSEATWGDGSDTDFQAGAELIGNRMLGGCPSWMAFVEGINADHSVTIDGTEYDYYDWYGGGLQDAEDYPVELNTSNKVVYAPHYYTPAVYPQAYFYNGGTSESNGAISDYVEIDNDTLLTRVEGTTNDMFAYLVSDTGPAVLLGEFGGLYATDLHPELTTKRCTDKTIETMVANSWAGGFVWSLNPESAYQYNPADTYGTFTEGILEDDWLTANSVFLEGLTAMNDLANLKSWPCFPVEVSSSGSSESASS